MLLLGCCGCCFTINKECSTHTTLAVLALLGLLRLDARYARAPRPAPTRSRAVVSEMVLPREIGLQAGMKPGHASKFADLLFSRS